MKSLGTCKTVPTVRGRHFFYVCGVSLYGTDDLVRLKTYGLSDALIIRPYVLRLVTSRKA